MTSFRPEDVLFNIDIISAVCEILYLEGDDTSLLSMALTCKAWVDPALSLLWRTICGDRCRPSLRLAMTTPEFQQLHNHRIYDVCRL